MDANILAGVSPELTSTVPRIADDPSLTVQILGIVEAVARELRPGRPAAFPTVNASLDRDLGLDSLARVELAARIEAAFTLTLPDSAIAAAETPADLIAAVQRAADPKVPAAAAVRYAPDERDATAAAPPDLISLPAVLDWHARHHGARTHVRLFADEGGGEALSYGDLHARASAVAAGLQAIGIVPGERIALMLPTGFEYFVGFFAALLSGAIAVPVYPPVRAGRIDEHLRRLEGILGNAAPSVLIVTDDLKDAASGPRARIASLRRIETIDSLATSGGRLERPAIGADDLALLQYTSGSTGNPKGVMLSHANLLANIRAMAAALAVTPADVFVSWLPLYHDMGLIGAWLGALHEGAPLVALSPLAFLARPSRWLDAIDHHHATLSGGPNFAFELCLRHTPDALRRRLDLSSWRVAFSGAEPVNAATVERFCSTFATAGFRREALMPVYGLAENCVGLAFPPLGRGPRIERIRRAALADERRAVLALADDPNPVRLVACGEPLPSHEIRIVDSAGVERSDREEGRVQFRGPSASRGYWNNPEATRHLVRGDWRETGDLGYLAGSDLFLTGRTKDLIIRAGRNLHPADIEAAAAGVDGVLPGRTAAFGAADADGGTERLIVVVETRRHVAAETQRLREGVIAAVTETAGEPPDTVVLAAPNAIPRTSSGKVRRAACRGLWLEGRLTGDTAARSRPRHGEAMRRAGRAQAQRLARSVQLLAYAGWAWTVIAVGITLAAMAILALPRLSWRWRALRGTARLVLHACAIPLRVDGQEHLPPGACVIVANHASYLDVLALAAALPRPVAFVAKAELRKTWTARLLLRRIGTCFVERFDRQKGLEDYRRIAAAARDGRSPLFFAEGTFRRVPGLMPFRMGAFACAVEAGLPVLPVVLRGTRAILRGETRVPRRGAISVVITPPQAADDSGDRWAAAVTLRERARQAILSLCDEADAQSAVRHVQAAAVQEHPPVHEAQPATLNPRHSK
ncbi:MAG: AMP-binding protein [Rhodospirillales bacterium]|nr:AMP-binding protein [Rhodospirillales bacterium]